MGRTSCQPAERSPFAGRSTNIVLSAASCIPKPDINRRFPVFRTTARHSYTSWVCPSGMLCAHFKFTSSQHVFFNDFLKCLSLYPGCAEGLKRCSCDLIGAYCDVVVQYGGSLLRRTANVRNGCANAQDRWQTVDVECWAFYENLHNGHRVFWRSTNMSHNLRYCEIYVEKSEI